MPSTKKRARSPEIHGPLSTRQSTSVQIHRKAPSERRFRGPKYARIKALRELASKRRAEIFQDTPYNPIIARVHQLNTSVCHTAPAPVESPLQSTPGLAVPHSPPSLPAEGDEGGLEGFNDSPMSSHIPLGPDLRTASSIRDNRALFHQTHHLDDHTPAWNQRRDDQATQWESVAIPRLIPIYLANRAATKSGRSSPLPMPNRECKCIKVALKVEMVTWDRKFSPYLFQLIANCVQHQDPLNKYCLSVNAIRLVYS